MATSATAPDTAINAFQFHAPDEALADLRRQIAATTWPEGELVTDVSQGGADRDHAQTRTLLVDRARPAQDRSELNALPQFVTNIDGVDIHFIHVCSKESNAAGLRKRIPT